MKKILLLFALYTFCQLKITAQCSEISQLFIGGIEERGSTVTGFLQEDNGDIVFMWNDNTGGNPWTNYDSKIYLTKLSSEGNIIWEHEFGTSGYDGSGEILAYDEGYIISGIGRDIGPNWSDSFVTRLDNQGNVQWQTVLGGDSYGDNYATDLTKDSNGNILLTGGVQHHTGCSGYALRVTQISPSGEINWSHCYNENQDIAVQPIFLESTSEYLFGVTIDEGVRIIKKGLDGVSTYDQDFLPSELVGTGDDLRGKFKKGLNDDYLLISGNPADCFSSSIIKFNAQNEVEWKIIEPCITAYANEAIVLEDGSWIIQFYEAGSSYFKRLSTEGEVLFTSEVINDLVISQIGLTANNDIIYSGRYGLWENGDAVVEVLTCSELTEIDTVTEPTCQTPNYIPTDGLVAYYPFCGDVNDLSGNELDGTAQGALLHEGFDGTENSSYSLDGIDDYLSFPSGIDNELNTPNDYSYSYWMKSEGGVGNNGGLQLSFGDNVSNGGGFNSGINLCNVGLGILGVSGNNISCYASNQNNLEDGSWHQITVTYNDGLLTLFLDGALDNQFENTLPTPSWAGNRVFGCRSDLFMTPDANYRGLVDELMVFNRALTQEEVTNIYNSESTEETAFCNNQPQGLAPETGGWEYHDFYVPEGMKIDSLFADFERPGHPVEELDFAWSYCQGCEEYNSNYDVSFFNYTETTNSLYDTWLDATAESFIGPGVARVIAPTNAGVIWEDFCYSLSESECVAPNPCAFNYSEGDLDCDGQVTVNDLSVILTNFGSMVESELEN
jgi:hypothetical protein